MHEIIITYTYLSISVMAERGIWGVGQVRWFHGVVDYYIRDDLVLLPTLVVVLG